MAATSGSAISGLGSGADVTQGILRYRAQLSTTNEENSAQLDEVRVSILKQ